MLNSVNAVRQNHALEHATIHLLGRRHPTVRVAGRTTLAGFVIYGRLDTDDVRETAGEALFRLQGGESHLAVHPRCGTNLVVTALMSGAAGLVAGLDDRRSKLERLPSMVVAATLAAMAAQPLAHIVQQRITTSSSLDGVYIADVERQEVGRLVWHRIQVGRR